MSPARQLRKRVLLTLGALSFGVVAVTGYAFLNSNAIATTSISGTTSNTGAVFTSNPSTVPTDMPTTWYCNGPTASTATATFTETSGCSAPPSSQFYGPVAPGWTPTVNATGSVTYAGDVAMVDAGKGSGGVLVTVALTNTAALSAGYSYLNLPLAVQAWNGTAWVSAKDASGAYIGYSSAGGADNGVQYLGLTTGYLTFDLPASGNSNSVYSSTTSPAYYEVIIPQGGSFYTISSSSSSDLAPSFDVSATPTN